MEKASCIGVPIEYFFDKYLEDEDIAIEVINLCKNCPVKTECLNYGIKTKSTGIWGGRWLGSGRVMKNKELIISEYIL